MKHLYSYDEIADLIEQGQTVQLISPVQVLVTATRKAERSAIQVTMVLLVGEYAIADVMTEFESIDALLDAFDLTSSQEVFEVLP